MVSRAAFRYSNAFTGTGSDLSATEASHLAISEALGRLAAISSWDGELPVATISTFIPGTELVLIRHDAGVGEVVILARRTRAGRAYGRAAGRTVVEAARNAAIELARAEFALTSHHATGAMVVSANFHDRRILWIAGAAGAAAIQRRMASRPEQPAPAWQTTFDGEIPGPS